jgi:hypothetical protein
VVEPQYRRPGTLWYVGDGYIWDDLPTRYRRERGRPLECSSKLLIYNPQRKAARVSARFYHTDRPPTSVAVKVKPGRIETLELAALPEVPHRQSFWTVVEADVPVLPQARHEDFTFWDPVPDALISVAPYPGPLVDETSWVFPDCYQSVEGRGSWFEVETLSILNPARRPVEVKLRYLLRNRDGGGEEEVTIAAERVAQLNIWERFPRALGTKNGPPVCPLGDYAIRLDASGPVLPQITRRARWSGRPSVVGARSLMAFPLRKRDHRLWYYPGGLIVDRGILPRARPGQHPLSQCDNTWNLLFINNLKEKGLARARVSFHKPDGTKLESPSLPIKPLKSILECLHGEPWLGKFTRVGEPFALTVTADGPVCPEVTCAEFEMWSQVCPGAMSGVNFYPGPLRTERCWWLGIGSAGGDDSLNPEWAQSYHFLNPGRSSLCVRLSFLGAGRTRMHEVDVPPGGVRVVDASQVRGLPVDRPFAVRAEGSGAFCAQTFVRAFTRGLAHTRSMYSLMGVPMTLTSPR